MIKYLLHKYDETIRKADGEIRKREEEEDISSIESYCMFTQSENITKTELGLFIR